MFEKSQPISRVSALRSEHPLNASQCYSRRTPATFGMVLALVGLSSVLFAGCAGSGSQQQSAAKPGQQEGVPATSPVLRMADHHEWVKRLLVSPPVEAIQLTSGNSAASAVFPVPLLPSVGAMYSLKVDRQSQLVWLQTHGYGGQVQQVDGPWKMDQPDAAHLLHSITTPPSSLAGNPQQKQ